MFEILHDNSRDLILLHERNYWELSEEQRAYITIAKLILEHFLPIFGYGLYYLPISLKQIPDHEYVLI